jgi:hypothetical protein
MATAPVVATTRVDPVPARNSWTAASAAEVTAWVAATGSAPVDGGAQTVKAGAVPAAAGTRRQSSVDSVDSEVAVEFSRSTSESTDTTGEPAGSTARIV